MSIDLSKQTTAKKKPKKNNKINMEMFIYPLIHHVSIIYPLLCVYRVFLYASFIPGSEDVRNKTLYGVIKHCYRPPAIFCHLRGEAGANPM